MDHLFTTCFLKLAKSSILNKTNKNTSSAIVLEHSSYHPFKKLAHSNMDDAGRLAWAAGGPGGRHHKQSCFQGMLVATSLGLQKTVFDFQVPFCPTFCR